MKNDNSVIDLNSELPETSGAPSSIEDIIARGAEAATATETETAPEAGTGIEFTDTPKRKYKRRARAAAEPTPDELAAQKAAQELDAFFSPEGIGTVFTNGLNAFYVACAAAPLTTEEQPLLAKVFAQWARYRLPAGASSYQPDILLVAVIAMTTLPRMQPIATTTAPFWRRFFGRFTAPWRRKPSV